MNYLIICEKPSQARAFADALGGRTGELNGNPYLITNLYGHILENGQPHETALPEFRERIGGFSQLAGIPWAANQFDFYKKRIKKAPDGFDGYQQAFDQIKLYLGKGYVPIIASDIDAMCEGDLLVHEVLDLCGYEGKRFREYHVSEEAPDILKSLNNLKEVTAKDPAYMTGFTRSNVDYLTQQLTRVATIGLQNKGYQLPGPVPFGRLKSVMLKLVGEQLDAIAAYKPSSVFESRYRLDNLILSNKDMIQYKTKEEWQADGLPLTAKVKKVKEVPGRTQPPKPLNLTKLSGLMSKAGISVKKTLELAQKLYENGDGSGKNYLSYPRTEEDTITYEQFNDILPMIDSYIGLLGMPTTPFTHREPRSTHVKDTGAHGALRPGAIPKSLDELDQKFGKGAGLIYKIVTERFLLQFLEDTEWVRHEYETETNPVFKGSVKIITKQGVVDPDKKEETATKLPDITKEAELYPHEVKSTKPKNPTTDWLLSQLEKHGVGTPSTQSSTVVQMVGNTDNFPIRDGKVLKLSPIGRVGYIAAKGTIIGSVEGTKKLQEMILGIQKGKNSPEDVYAVFEDIIAKDVETIRQNDFNPSDLGLTQGAPKVRGNWKGRDIQFKGVYCEHVFTDDEITKLLNDETITFKGIVQEKEATITGKLEDQVYKNIAYVGFKGTIVRSDQVKGVWKGKEVTIKKIFAGYEFSEEELAKLFNDETIQITTPKGTFDGKLEVQDYQGHKYVGFKARFPERTDQAKGVWKGKEIAIKNIFAGHTFTDDELKRLFNDEKITIETEKGTFEGKLEVQEYQGRKYVGFKAQFPQKEGYAYGQFKGKDAHFKREFMKHVFTDDEVALLFAGKEISFTGESKNGPMEVKGKLEYQVYQGREFLGFKADFGKKK